MPGSDQHRIVLTPDGPVRGIRRRCEPAGGGGDTLFRGIPFAAPPVGALRFAAPAPVTAWTRVRDATRPGATPQRLKASEPTLIPEPVIAGTDTLVLDVCTPDTDPPEPLPVLVWIHGGAFVSGSPASPWYDGRAFARDGVVTVAISYRLGFDGFGAVPGAPANRGVLDWLAALRWVRRSIRAFGGDPGRVTIAGQSAGGGAVLTLLGMPAAQGLFHGAIALSPALGDATTATAVERTTRLAASLGVAATRAGFESVAQERFVAAQEAAAQAPSRNRIRTVRAMLEDGLPWGPQVDGELVPRPTLESIRAGVGAGIPLVLGATDDEFAMVTARYRGALAPVPASLALRMLGLRGGVRRRYLRANRGRSTAGLLGRYVTDRVFRRLVPLVAQARGASSPTWAYRFAWPSPTIGWACHCLDVPFFFDALDADAVAAVAGEHPPQQLASEMHGAAVAFAASGDPGWARYAGDATTRVFGGPLPLVDDGYRTVAALI